MKNGGLNGHEAKLDTVTLESPGGLSLAVLNLGATIHSLEVPSPDGPRNIVLAYSDIHDYASDRFYIGSTVGPFANRIRDARFVLDGKHVALDANESATGHCLHGGYDGLHRQVFATDVDPDRNTVTCSCRLPAGLGGFPGNRSVTVVYELLDANSLAIDFSVISDTDTVVSLANHAYFNLGGPLAEHELRVCADAYTPVHAGNVPTGEIRPVSGSEFDLRDMRPLGDAQFDHNFVLANGVDEPRLAAQLRLASSGIGLNVHTTQPGLQLYTADHIAAPFVPRGGLCLEAQGFPDAPNQPGFPSARLAAGSRYWQRTIYEFISI